MDLKKGLLVHVGDDANPSAMNRDHSKYSIHLLPNHRDPDLDHLTFGDWLDKSTKFDELHKGDHIFFNYKFSQQLEGFPWYIASHFCVSEVRKGNELLGQLEKRPPYKYNAHIIRGDLRRGDVPLDNFRMFVGDPNHSQGHLRGPIRINSAFWKVMRLRDEDGVPLLTRLNQKRRKNSEYSEMQINGSYLRKPKLLDAVQTDLILEMTRQRLYSYVLKFDRCFAPHVDKGGRYLTLATCKPDIRKEAQVGDWILGVGGKILSNNSGRDVVDRAIYLAEVTGFTDYDQYYDDHRFTGRDDNIYFYDDVKRKWQQAENARDHNNRDDRNYDLSHAHRVLISNNFVYFGWRGPMVKPELLIKRGPKHKVFYLDESSIARNFIKRIRTSFRSKFNKYAEPTQSEEEPEPHKTRCR